MKKIGILALVIGILGLIATFSMDTTGGSWGGTRIHNIGLMNMQQNLLLVFIALAIAGVVILVNNRETKSLTSSVIPDAIDKNQAYRTCPFCAERIKGQAVVCRYCGRGVDPPEDISIKDENSPIRSKKPTAIEKLSIYLVATESFIRHIYSLLKNTKTNAKLLQPFLILISSNINKIAAFLVAFGVAMYIYWAFFYDYLFAAKEMHAPSWYASYHLFYRLTESASIIMAGLIIYFRTVFIKPDKTNIIDSTIVTHTGDKANKSSLPFFGVHLDLAVSQLVVVFLIFYLHNNYHQYIAYFLSILAALIGCLLFISGNNLYYGVITSLIGCSYIYYRETSFNEYLYSGEAYSEGISHLPSYINIAPYLWILMLSIAIPYVKLLKFGSLKYGNLRGDITLTIIDHKIFIPFCSALIFYVLLHGISFALLWSRSVFLGYLPVKFL